MKKYQIIVIDPPWPVKKLTHKARPKQTTMDYKTMTVDEIKKLPIGKLANDACWCFLWTTQKYLFDSKPILEQWGFRHLLTMVWEKTYGRSAGMPLFGFRWNAEFILVGYKDKPELWPKRKLIPAVFDVCSFVSDVSKINLAGAVTFSPCVVASGISDSHVSKFLSLAFRQ